MIVHVTKYGNFRPGVMGQPTGFYHRGPAGRVGTCRVCGRQVIRGAGRWWEQ